MTEEIAKTASELLKEKSKLIDDLSKLKDEPKNTSDCFGYGNNYYYLTLCYNYSERFRFGGGNSSLNINEDEKIVEKVKNLLILEINKKIEEIDKELSSLSCN
jgi:hypothetical protein